MDDHAPPDLVLSVPWNSVLIKKMTFLATLTDSTMLLCVNLASYLSIIRQATVNHAVVKISNKLTFFNNLNIFNNRVLWTRKEEVSVKSRSYIYVIFLVSDVTYVYLHVKSSSPDFCYNLCYCYFVLL